MAKYHKIKNAHGNLFENIYTQELCANSMEDFALVVNRWIGYYTALQHDLDQTVKKLNHKKQKKEKQKNGQR